MTLSDKEKLGFYDYTVYDLEMTLESRLLDADEKWLESKEQIFLRSKLVSTKETLYFLTHDELWSKSVEELKKIVTEHDSFDDYRSFISQRNEESPC